MGSVWRRVLRLAARWVLTVAAAMPAAAVGAAGPSSADRPMSLAISDRRDIDLGGVPIVLSLRPTAAFAAVLGGRGMSRPGNLYLIVTGIRAAAPVGGTYNVFLGRPSQAPSRATTDVGFVGTFGFFDAIGVGEAGGVDTGFEVTDRAAELASGDLVVTLSPAGQPAPGSQPRIVRVELVFVARGQ